jgi:hypothetical protein
MSEYSLDVVFNSTTKPLNTGPIYAMGFGFAESPSGTWKEDGQQVEKVRVGSIFYFSVFDTAPTSQASVEKVEVSFFDPDNPAVKWPYSPLSDAEPNSTSGTLPNPLVASRPAISVGGEEGSPGCNVANATVWRIGPYIVTLPDNIPTLILDCRVTITVCVDPADPNSTQQFSVDPEIQMEGGGGG